jgi:hypothetical protein
MSSDSDNGDRKVVANEASGNASIARLLERVEELERRLIEVQQPEAQPDISAVRGNKDSVRPVAAEGVSNRRSFLRLAGAASVGAVAATIASASPAAAANGDNIAQGTNTTGSTVTKVTNTSSQPNDNLDPINDAAILGTGGRNAVGLSGVSSGPGGAGVLGESLDGGFGLYGVGNGGYAVFAGGNGRIGLSGHSTDVPTDGRYSLGDIIRTTSGDMYVCVVPGTVSPPFPGRFQKIAGPSAAGAMHFIPSPTRIFDSRSDQQPLGGYKGRVVNGTEIVVDVWFRSAAVPAGATTAIISLLVFDALSGGYITAFEDGTSNPGTINAYWSAGMQSCSTTFVRMNASSRFRLRCAAEPGGINLAVDIIGYIR